MVVKFYIVILYVKTISSLIQGCQCFGGTYCHLQTVLKMEVAGSSETLVTAYYNIWCHNSGHHSPNATEYS